MKICSFLLTLFAVLLVSACQTQSFLDAKPSRTISTPLVILTDMEPDDRIALILASDLLAERLVLVGTGVRHAVRKSDLAALLLEQEGLSEIMVVPGTGYRAENTPKAPGTAPARLYRKEGQGILSAAQLAQYQNQPHTSRHLQIQLSQILAQNPQTEIIALAPLTDLAAVLQARPELASRISQLHIMGGWRERGQMRFGTYNWNMDPQAAVRILTMQQLPIRLYSSHLFKHLFAGGSVNAGNAPEVIAGLDAAAKSSASIGDFVVAARSWDQHVMALIPALTRRIGPYAGHQFSPSDPFTLAAAAQPELVIATRKVAVIIDVDGKDPLPGFEIQVRADPASHIELVEQIDVQQFHQLLINSFNRRASPGAKLSTAHND